MQLYWFAVLSKPSKKAAEDGAEADILVQPFAIYAKDEQDASMKGSIKCADQLKALGNKIEVVVTPL